MAKRKSKLARSSARTETGRRSLIIGSGSGKARSGLTDAAAPPVGKRKLPQGFGELLQDAFHQKRVEPIKRMVGGKYGWAVHRFPIKGGVSLTVVLADNITRNNALWNKLKK